MGITADLSAISADWTAGLSTGFTGDSFKTCVGLVLIEGACTAVWFGLMATGLGTILSTAAGSKAGFGAIFAAAVGRWTWTGLGASTCLGGALCLMVTGLVASFGIIVGRTTGRVALCVALFVAADFLLKRRILPKS
ncbi:hypothetical protein ACFS7Z_13805 [Pontibacter toksunensis]|uniref:Uncharacterized protein n=1 Tax=Pontibacter toksunensis TaxID=1332631 RepID=A0ABW6BWP5_9BACT